MTSPPTGATIRCGESRMHPRLPRVGNRNRSRTSASFPNKTAGGPSLHWPLQFALGTYGSSLAPAAMVAGAVMGVAGTGQIGGSAGWVKAGCGKRTRGMLRFLSRPNKPPASPADPGNAIDVVVGSGAKRREPVGSIAGNRRPAQPLVNMNNNDMAISQNRSLFESFGLGTAVVFTARLAPS